MSCVASGRHRASSKVKKKGSTGGVSRTQRSTTLLSRCYGTVSATPPLNGQSASRARQLHGLGGQMPICWISRICFRRTEKARWHIKCCRIDLISKQPRKETNDISICAAVSNIFSAAQLEWDHRSRQFEINISVSGDPHLSTPLANRLWSFPADRRAFISLGSVGNWM